MQQFERITAIFKPKKLETLKPEVLKDIGWIGEWQAVWIIENGEYIGQWAFSPINKNNYTFGWVPEEDLEFIQN